MSPATPKFEDGLVVEKACPECGNPTLIVRTNGKNGGQFLGCPNWPECKHTEPIPEERIMRASGQPELFDGAG